MGSNDEKKPSLLKHMTNIIFRPKPEVSAAPKLTPEQEEAKKAEAEEKRKKMLDAYSKHCEEVDATEPVDKDKPPPKKVKYKARDFNE
jgi:hypothetical protein